MRGKSRATLVEETENACLHKSVSLVTGVTLLLTFQQIGPHCGTRRAVSSGSHVLLYKVMNGSLLLKRQQIGPHLWHLVRLDLCTDRDEKRVYHQYIGRIVVYKLVVDHIRCCVRLWVGG